jgi:serine protease Do
VEILSINDQIQEELQLKSNQGAFVNQIQKGSPADEAGLQLMDVITYFDGKPVKDSNDLVNHVRSGKIGKRIELKLIRKKNEIITSIVLRARPN